MATTETGSGGNPQTGKPKSQGAGKERRPHVVIIGGGFGGISVARSLKRADVDITVLERTNHFLFQPLLYQVATAALSPADIATPVRYLLRKQKNTVVLMAEARKIDVERKIIVLDDKGSGDIYNPPREIAYDYLVVATGARHSYFKNPEWETLAPGLKTLEDAREVRRRFLTAFENAEKCDDEDERKAWQTFVIVGGGPTGCELAGVIPEIARKAMANNFRRIKTSDTKVILVEAGKRILPQFPEELAARALKDLTQLDVEVWTDAPVTVITKEGVTAGGEFVPAKTVFWGAGNQASPLAKDLGCELDKAGRVMVADDLSVPNRPEIFVIGDLANFYQDKTNNKSVPWVAQGAIQGGKTAAKNIVARIKGEATTPFSYWNKGDMAVIGRNRAIAHIGNAKIGGLLAWLMWAFIHILYLASFRNRIVVAMEWAYAYLTYERGARILGYQEVNAPAQGVKQ